MLPSARENIARRTFNTKNFGNTEFCIHEKVPLYPGEICSPQDYLSSFLQHLFPRNEPFLLANQVEVDPISKLSAEKLGQLMSAIEYCSPECRIEIFSLILDLNLQAPSIRNIKSEIFNRQDALVGLHRLFEMNVDEDDLKEIENFDPAYPMTSYVKNKIPDTFKKIGLIDGELEVATKLPYSDNAVRLLRKRRFVEVLTTALGEEGVDFRTVQESVAAFFWRRAQSGENIRKFYEGYRGEPLVLPDRLFESGFQLQDFESLTARATTFPVSYFSLLPEERFFLVSRTNLMNFLPIPYSVAQFASSSYADCVETGIRNALMRLAFILRDEKPVFDPSLLPEGSAARAYAEGHSTWELLLSSEGRNAWSETVSNKPQNGMGYYKKKPQGHYELKSDLKTVINAFRYLLGLSLVKGAFDEGAVSNHLSSISEALTLSSKRTIQLKLAPGAEVSKGLGEIEFYFDGEESYTGKLKVESNHAAYEVASSKKMPWIEETLKTVAVPSHLPLVASLVKDPAETIGCLVKKPEESLFKGRYGNYTFTESATLSPIFSYVRSLPPQERLRFYKSIDTREVDIYAILINFILTQDPSNFPYMLRMLGKIDFLEDRYATTKMCSSVFPRIFEGTITSEKILTVVDSASFLFSDSYGGLSLFDWATRENKTEILEHRNEQVKGLKIAQTVLEEDFEKASGYLKQFPTLESLIYQKDSPPFGEESLLYLKGMEFLIGCLPDSLQEFCVCIFPSDEKSKSYFLKNIKEFLRRYPKKIINSWSALTEEEFRKIITELRDDKLPYQKFQGATYDAGIHKSFSEYYTEFDQLAAAATEPLAN